MLKHAFVLVTLLGAVAACGDPEPASVDATPLPPDAVPPATIVSELSDPEWVALCEELFTPAVTFASSALDCASEDCDVSPTAVEDCVSEVVAEPQDCSPPDAAAPIRDCDATIAQMTTCYEAFFNQILPYGTATCENVAAIPPLMLPNNLPECDGLLTKCPDAFSDN